MSGFRDGQVCAYSQDGKPRGSQVQHKPARAVCFRDGPKGKGPRGEPCPSWNRILTNEEK